MNKRTAGWALSVLVALLTACSSVPTSQEKGQAGPLPGFPEASLTILPITLNVVGPIDKTAHHQRFAEAYRSGFREKGGEFARTIGLILEEKGYDRWALADAYFEFPTPAGPGDGRAAAFGEFVRELDLETDFALCTQFTLHIEKSWQEVYSVIVDSEGGVVWEDSQGWGDPAFDRDAPGTEFGCCELVARRLASVMALDELPQTDLPEDKEMELREMRGRQPPGQAELEAMERRLKTMKEAGASARVVVHPTRVGGDHADASSAGRLAELLNEADLCAATAAETGPVLEGAGWPNEMAVLSIFARAVRQYVRQHPSDNEYVLFADYWFRPDGRAAHAVHFVVCDRAGDWVIMDLQNSHCEDFQRIRPKTVADCDRLVVERLESLLR
ncbi:MAG: hypothetical protein R6V05_14165 [Candidatus Brocadiia bacterium]